MFASSAVTPSTASMTTTATSALSKLLRAITTESFSAISSVLPLRRMPAVSTRRKVWPSASSTVSTASRVEQFGHAVAVLGRDGQHFAEAEAVELARVGFELGGVNLVRGDEDGLAR